MKFIIKYHSEMVIKSRSVRSRFCKILESNLRTLLRPIDPEVKILRDWNYLLITPSSSDPELISNLENRLATTPGIDHIALVSSRTFTTLEDLAQQVLTHYQGKIEPDQTFAVRARRRGRHLFTSLEVEREVGFHVGQAFPRARVKLKSPDVEVVLEIDQDQLFLIDRQRRGLGGFPVGTQEAVLSLLSGGYDSGVASYEMIRRGLKTHYLFFNLGGTRHEAAVRDLAWYLWNQYGASHRVRFLIVPFEPIMGEILETISDGYRGVILKRMMLRAAERVANRLRIPALVTGESIGQVSSQTLRNLSVIDEVTDRLVLRPLIVADKQSIIDQAKQIGTEPLTRSLPEYCGMVTARPTVEARPEQVIKEESYFDFNVLDEALENLINLDIRELATPITILEEEHIEVVTAVRPRDIVIDVRAPFEQERAPLEVEELEGVELIHIPFYRIEKRVGELDPTRRYLLYCEQGTMSQIQAAQLIRKGISLAKVYQPS